jgi:predicted dehydrogenase
MTVTRRDFVEHALALAGAALAATPSLAVGQEAAPAKDLGPNERLRVAVVGLNGRGDSHLSAWLSDPNAEIVSVCDVDPAAIEKRRSRFKDRRLPTAVQDFRKLLDDPTVDAVSIATPNHWHALMSIWAMQAGKDVYVEKPCSFTVDEGREMTKWARKLGRICQMGAQSRSMTGMRESIAFIQGGGIGEMKVAHALCYKRRQSIGWVNAPAPIPPGLDFDLWAGPAPAIVPVRQRLHYDWHWNRLTGNGDLGNQNPHELDKARWALGKNELPKRVVSMGGRLGYVDNGDTANSQLTIFQWDDALLISEVRGLEIKTPPTIGRKGGPLGVANIYWGTKGYLVTPNYASGVAFDYDGNELGKWTGGSDKLHFENFAAAVRSRNYADLHLDVEDGHYSSALAHLGNVSWMLGERVSLGTRPKLAASESHVVATLEGFEQHLKENDVDFTDTPLVLGRELTVDPSTERTGDPAADALFTRDYRKGYELPRV